MPNYRKNQPAARVKMAQAVLNMNAINQELAMHNFHQLRKSAAVGAHKEERLKVAALIRQSELEKQAFLSAFCKQAGNPGKSMKSLWSKPKPGVGKGVAAGAKGIGMAARSLTSMGDKGMVMPQQGRGLAAKGMVMPQQGRGLAAKGMVMPQQGLLPGWPEGTEGMVMPQPKTYQPGSSVPGIGYPK